MATFTLTAVDRFPEGTSVAAYPKSNWPNGMVDTSAAPKGSATDTQTMTSGTLTFTGLTAGTEYVAYAEVSSQHCYTSFTAGEDLADSAAAAQVNADETITGTWTHSGSLTVGSADTPGATNTIEGSILIEPSGGAAQNAIIIKAPDADWGDEDVLDYGQGQGIILLKEDTEGAVEPDDLVLYRVSAKGTVGASGGMHLATGFRKRAGDTFAYSMRIDPSDDIPGIYIDAANDAPASEYLACRTNSGTVRLLVRADGKLEHDAPMARVRNSANIAIADNTLTELTFDTELYDTDAIHSTSSNTSRLTCKTAGVYQVNGVVRFAASATGIRQAILQVNGTQTIASDLRNAASAGVTDIPISAPYKLAVNDYVEIKVLQTSTASLNVLQAGSYSPGLSMTYLGRGN